jgi:hypothetical protein
MKEFVMFIKKIEERKVCVKKIINIGQELFIGIYRVYRI